MGGFVISDDLFLKLLQFGYYMVVGIVDVVFFRDVVVVDIWKVRG